MENSKDMISVIIPTYNRSRELRQTLDSILEQDVDTRIEFVIIDDNSTDDTKPFAIDNLIHEINKDLLVKKKYKLVYLLNKNGPNGPSNARNFGLQHCNGDYVFFMDSDDKLYDRSSLNNLYKGIKQCEKETESKSCLVYGKTLMYHNLGQDLWEPIHLFSFPNFKVKTLARSDGLIPTGSFIFNKEIIKAVSNFNTSIAVGEDFEWQLRMAQKAYFRHIPHIVLKYYRGAGGQLNNGNKTQEDLNDSLKKIRNSRTDLLAMANPPADQEATVKAYPLLSDNEQIFKTVIEESTPKGASPIPVDLFISGNILTAQKEEDGVNKILWVVTEPKLNRDFVTILNSYKIVLVYNCSLSQKVKNAVDSNVLVETLRTPFHQYMYPPTPRIPTGEETRILLIDADDRMEEELKIQKLEYDILEDKTDVSKYLASVVSNIRYFNPLMVYPLITAQLPVFCTGTKGRGLVPVNSVMGFGSRESIAQQLSQYAKTKDSLKYMGAQGFNYFSTNQEYSVSFMLDTFSSIWSSYVAR